MPLPANKKICIASQSSTGERSTIKSVSRSYALHEFSTRALAEAALLSHSSCPLVDSDYGTLVRKPFTVRQKSAKQTDEWLADVTWERYVPEVLDNEKLTGSISLSSQNVKTTYSHVGSYGPGGGTALDAGGLINVTSDGAEGVDLDIPVLSFTIERQYAAGTWDLAFMQNAFPYVGLPNNVAWRNFGIGEVRIVGVDGREGDGDFDPISFSFQASPSFTNLVIPSPLGNITVPSKLGWQYLHVQYIDFHDATTGFTSKVAHTAHVDEISPGVNINGLIS